MRGICLISLLMKQLLSKSAQTTGQILILTGGFTDVRHGGEDGGTVERVAIEKNQPGCYVENERTAGESKHPCGSHKGAGYVHEAVGKADSVACFGASQNWSTERQ